MTKYFLFLSLIVQMTILFAQLESAPKPNIFLKLDYQHGSVLQSSDFFRGENASGEAIKRVQAFTLEVGWQSSGTNEFDALMGYPAYGVGLSTYLFPTTDELGEPAALYMFLDGPFKRWNRFSIKYIVRLGLSYNFSPADPIENPFNLVIGSYKNLYINGGVNVEYSVGNRVELGAGITAAHFSNGRSTVPNTGLNIFTPNIYAKYHFNQGRGFNYKKFEISPFEPTTELLFVFGHGTHQKEFAADDTGAPDQIAVNFPNFNFSTTLNRHFIRPLKLGAGLDIVYFGPTNAEVELTDGGIWKKVNTSVADKMQLGLFANIEWVMNNVSFYAQPGYRIYQKKEFKTRPNFYQHLALKYHIQDVILGMGIRATQFTRAEFIEWDLGYRFKWGKKNS
ncbi:MAG: acyloxyacyl hydrolase [Cyclobacteriaceae bacterium]